MVYSQEIIDKIFNYKTLSKKQKIDKLLEMDVTQYANCGIDTTKADKLIVKNG